MTLKHLDVALNTSKTPRILEALGVLHPLIGSKSIQTELLLVHLVRWEVCIFNTFPGFFKGYFSIYLGTFTTFEAELFAIIFALEKA